MVSCECQEEVCDMSKVNSKTNENVAAVTYSEAAWKRAYAKYSFAFTIQGEGYRTWYNPNTESMYFDCADKAEALYEVGDKIDELLRESGLNARIDIIDLYNFVRKHSRAMIKVMQALRGTPASEHRYQLLGSDAINADEVSLEQSLSEVSGDQKKTLH
jgi:hypothetical protein